MKFAHHQLIVAAPDRFRVRGRNHHVRALVTAETPACRWRSEFLANTGSQFFTRIIHTTLGVGEPKHFGPTLLKFNHRRLDDVKIPRNHVRLNSVPESHSFYS